MKNIKIALSIAVLLGTLGVVGMSSSQVAFAEAGVKCNCEYTSGALGVIRNNDCVVENCWFEIE